jgi:predicted RNase H-like HicB family nuclease
MEARIMSRKYALSLIYYPQYGGGYTVICPELRSCFSEGDTIEEAEANIRELIAEFMPEQIGHSDDSREYFREGLGIKGRMFAEIEIEETDAGAFVFPAKAERVAV